jgi:hypothetical protein
MSNKQNETKTVAWFVAAKSLIKFVDETDSRNIADNVMAVSDFKKYPILKGDVVEVGIKDEDVVFLRKVKGVKKPYTKKETTPVNTDNAKTEEVKIFAVAGNKKVLKFEKDGDWIPIATDLQTKDYSDLGLVAGNTVTVALAEGTIVGVENTANESPVEPKAENVTTPTPKKHSYRDEDSTDKRTASMNAKDVVVALLNNKEIDKTKVQSAIEDLTKAFYKITKNL